MSFDLKLVNGDLSIQPSGTIEPVFNEQKLIQDMLKALFTPVGSHQLHKWYGSPLQDRIGGKVIDPAILDTIIKDGIVYSLKNLQTLQDLQQRDGQFVTPREIIKTIDDVEIYQDESDLRQLNIFIRVTTRSGNTIEEGIVVAL